MGAGRSGVRPYSVLFLQRGRFIEGCQVIGGQPSARGESCLDGPVWCWVNATAPGALVAMRDVNSIFVNERLDRRGWSGTLAAQASQGRPRHQHHACDTTTTRRPGPSNTGYPHRRPQSIGISASGPMLDHGAFARCIQSSRTQIVGPRSWAKAPVRPVGRFLQRRRRWKTSISESLSARTALFNFRGQFRRRFSLRITLVLATHS